MAMLLSRKLMVALSSAMMMDMKLLVILQYLVLSAEMKECPETVGNLKKEQNWSVVPLVSRFVTTHWASYIFID